MVIAGKPRGNAPQLASYLLAIGENERITILDVDGYNNADAGYLKDTLYSMELNSELTRSSNSIYHAYINPNPDDTTDRAMTMEEWQQSVDILTKQLGYEDQRRVIVLHEKPGARVHAHIVYERYNHERGTMATYEHNYKAHDRARAEMEKKLNHKPTPQKNKNHDYHKQSLTAIWQRTNTAKQFINEAEANGYKIAKGTDRPFRVVDADGVSFDLVRKLDGVKTAEVRRRFGDTDLMPDKEAIREMQGKKQQHKQDHATEATEKHKPEMPQAEPNAHAPAKTPADDTTAQDRERQQFLQNIKDVRTRNRSLTREITLYVLLALKVSFSFSVQSVKQIKPDSIMPLARQFANNAVDITAREKPPPQQQSEKAIHYWQAARIYKPT